MSDFIDAIEHSAQGLKRAFDGSFASAPERRDADTEDFLAIRLGGDPYALRLREISGLFADRRISPLPSGLAELLGIAGFRGTILPVYDLRALLGYPASSTPRWLVTSADKPLSFAFDAFEGHMRLERSVIVQHADARRTHVRELARGELARPIIRLVSVLETVEQRSLEVNKNRER